MCFDGPRTNLSWKFKRHFQPSNEVLKEFPCDGDDFVMEFENLLKGFHDRIVYDNRNKLK